MVFTRFLSIFSALGGYLMPPAKSSKPVGDMQEKKIVEKTLKDLTAFAQTEIITRKASAAPQEGPSFRSFKIGGLSAIHPPSIRMIEQAFKDIETLCDSRLSCRASFISPSQGGVSDPKPEPARIQITVDSSAAASSFYIPKKCFGG